MAKPSKLRVELNDLLEKVDEEGLKFLIRQARTIVHNLEVDRVNQEIQRLGDEASELDQEETRAVTTTSPRRDYAVKIEERGGGKSFVMDLSGKRKVFSLDEMRSLARICQAASSTEDGSTRLYNWFKQNRSDLFADAGIGNSRHPVLGLIYAEIRDRYKPRQT